MSNICETWELTLFDSKDVSFNGLIESYGECVTYSEAESRRQVYQKENDSCEIDSDLYTFRVVKVTREIL